jgi:hypothetical protein
MGKGMIPTLKELEIMLTGGSRDNVTFTAKARAVEGDDIDPNKLIDGFSEKPFVTVGVHEDAGMHIPPPVEKNEDGSTPKTPEPVSIAAVAFWNEYGTYRNGKVHIPARSFMRSTLEEKKAEHAKLFDQIVGAILKGAMTVHNGLEIFGEKIQADIQNKITTLKDPENAKATLDAKYPRTNPLINSGQMRNSIRYHVGGSKRE